MAQVEVAIRVRGGSIGRDERGAAASLLEPTPLVLSIAALLSAATAALLSLLVRDALRGPDVTIGNLLGTVLVMLAVTVPVLAASFLLVARGYVVAVIGWAGAVGSLAYQSVLLLFATPFNAFFFVYVALLGCSVWSLIAIGSRLDVGRVAPSIGAHAPVRVVAAYLLVNVALFGFLWLSALVPAVLSTAPPVFLEGTGMTTGPVQVMDLAFTLPVTILAAVLLLLRRPWGYVLTGSLLVMLAIETASIGVDQWFGHAADPASPAASAGLTPVMAVLTVIGVGVLVLFLRPGGRSAR